MPSRVVRPDDIKLQISGGDWLLVKKRLTAGERHASFERMYLKNADGSFVVLPIGGLAVSASRIAMATVTAYLLDWSLTTPDDKPLVIRDKPLEVMERALGSIDEESFTEIRKAIDAHEAAMAQERADLKKIPDGEPGKSAISPSLSAADGPSSESVN